MEEFANLPDTWQNYLNQVRQMLDALDEAERWVPDDRVTLENIIHLSKDNLEGHISRDELNYGAETTHGLSAEYELLLQQHLDSAVARMQTIDPNYSPPQIEKKVGGDCFVVTATMGDNLHPYAITLRAFRDDTLSKHGLGQWLINLYYNVGPRMAEMIRRSDALRAASYVLLVRPAALLVKLIANR